MVIIIRVFLCVCALAMPFNQMQMRFAMEKGLEQIARWRRDTRLCVCLTLTVLSRQSSDCVGCRGVGFDLAVLKSIALGLLQLPIQSKEMHGCGRRERERHLTLKNV